VTTLTRALLKQVRGELYDLFGEGEFMHIGCDEAYYYTRCDKDRKKLPAFLKSLTDEVAEEGDGLWCGWICCLKKISITRHTAHTQPVNLTKWK